MGCNYNYQGKEFQTKEELVEYINVNSPTTKTSNFKLEGEDKEWNKSIMQSDAQNEYGTSEFMTFSLDEDGNYDVSIDVESLNELSGKIKTYPTVDGGVVNLNTDTIINDLVKQDKLPNVIAPEQVVLGILADKAIIKAEKIATNQKGFEKESDEAMAAKLITFAEKLGISVTTITNYMEQNASRVNGDASIEALADMMKKVIAVSNKNDISQLSEEVSHFAIEYHMNSGIISKMLDKVDQTQEYQKEVEKYRIAYNNLQGEELERKVRKEILGKILASKIKDNFDLSTASNSTEIGIFSQLKELWDKFTSVFKITDENSKFFKEFGSVLDAIAKDVLAGDTSTFAPIDSNEVYYSLNTSQKELHEGINDLILRLESKYKGIQNLTSIERGKKIRELEDIRLKLVDAKVVQGLNSMLAVMNEDIVKAVSTIQNAKGRSGTMYDNIGTINLANIISFTSDVEHNLQVIRNFIIESDEINDTTKSSLLNTLNNVSLTYQNIKGDLDIIKSDASKKTMFKILDDFGVQSETIRQALTDMSSKVFKDVNWFVSNVFSLRSIDNPVVQAIFAMVVKANTNVNRHAAEFANKLVRLQQETGLTQSDTNKLYDEHYIINPIKASFFTDLEQAEKEVDEKYLPLLEKDPNNADIQLEYDRAKLAVQTKFMTLEYNTEFYESMFDYHPEVRKVISSRASAKNEVFRQYKKSDGTISLRNISFGDRQKLEEIDRQFKSMTALYEVNGERKTGIQLIIAEGLQDYSQGFNEELVREKYAEAIRQNPSKKFELEKKLKEKLEAIKNNQTTFKQEDFEKELNLIKRKYGENSKEFKDWISLNAFETYSEETLNLFESGGMTVDEQATAQKISVSDKIELIKNLGLKSNATYNEIYTKLLEKRRQLTKPYKKTGRFNEIQGTLVDALPELTQTLSEISSTLGLFSMLPSNKSSNIQSLGNEAFRTKYNELRKDKRALFQFLSQVGTLKGAVVDGYPVPLAYQYRTFRFMDESKAPIQKVYNPNYLWAEKKELTLIKNKDFNENFRGKTAQPNRALTQYINDDFYSLFGINKQDDFWGEKGVTTNNDLFRLRELLLKNKEANDKQLKRYNQYFQLPQVLSTSQEILGNGGNVKSVVKASLIRAVTTNNEGEFRSSYGTINKYYGKRVEDPKLISKDIGRIYGAYNEMAVNFIEKSKILPDITLLKERVDNNMLFAGGKKGKETNLAKMLDGFIDMNLYGQTLDVGGEFDPLGLSTKYLGHKLSGGKIANALYKHISFTNLAGNIFVPTVGAISSFTKSRVEAVAGNDVTTENLNWATGKVTKNISTYILDVGNLNPNNELKKLLNFAKVNVNPTEMYNGIFQSKAYRSSSNLGFKHYEAVAVVSGATALLAVFDNYRLVGNEFISYQEYLSNNKNKAEKEAKIEWDGYKSKTYYNYLKNEEGTPIVIDKDKLRQDGFDVSKLEALEAKMERQAEYFHAKIEGMVAPIDKGMFLKNPVFKFLGMHRGWFTNAVQDRFMAKHTDYISGRVTEGNYNTYARLIKGNIRNENLKGAEKIKSLLELHASLITLGLYGKGLENLDEFEKANIKTLGADMVAITALFALFILANAAADDDEDDYLKQYAAYISSRALSESLATTLPFSLNELYTILQSPVAGIGMIESLINAPSMFLNADKKINSGTYEGLDKWQRDMIKMTMLKNIFQPMHGNARKANLFFRTKVLTTPDNLLKNMTQEEEDKKGKKKKKKE